MDKLHKQLVAACKVVATGNRIVLQPESQGGSFIEDVRPKRRKRIYDRNGVYAPPVLPREAKPSKAFGTSGQVVPKRSAGSSVRPVTFAERSLGEGAETSGSASVDEDMVQEAEELKSVPAPVLPSEAEVEAHNVSHLPFRSWHHKADAKTKEAEQMPTVSMDYWFFGQPEDRAHDTLPCSLCVIAKTKAFGVIRCRRRVWCTQIQQGL